jgi:hypothetical protein
MPGHISVTVLKTKYESNKSIQKENTENLNCVSTETETIKKMKINE